jgi:hypothetical protein
VIHPAFSEVAGYIRRYESGWVIPHDDPQALREVVLGILADPEDARRRGERARRLAAEIFAWDKTTGPLGGFVRRPRMRHERTEHPEAARAAVTGDQQVARQHDAHTGPPEGYLITDTWNRRLPEKLDRVYGKRRSKSAQIAARSRGFLKALPTALVGRRARAVDGQMRSALSELVAGRSHGQRFLCPRNGLSGIEVLPATFGRANTCRLVLHIRTNPGAAADIHSLDLPTHEMKDGQPLAFRFPPMPDSANRWLYFVADSPDGVSGDAISMYAAPYAEHLQAQRYEDGLPADGVLVMTLEFN